MKSPFTGKEMRLHKEERSLKFRKDEFSIVYHSYKCDDTGEQFEDDVFAELNYNQLVNQYRSFYSIPFPDEIKSTRELYGLSAVKMSEILGFGVNSYRQYEAGEVPSQSNARLIQLASDPFKFKNLIALSNLNDADKAKVEIKIETAIKEKRIQIEKSCLENYLFGNKMPCKLNGYKKSDISKFTEMVIYFAKKMEPWKTVLNKLLFYADFEMYKTKCYSISGVEYRAIPYGPVPNNFDSIYEYLANEDFIKIDYTYFDSETPAEKFKCSPFRDFNPTLFNEMEQKILESVCEKFTGMSTKEIIEYSHEELAWINNNTEKSLIDYSYSFELKQNIL